jgi:hypothetical protein
MCFACTEAGWKGFHTSDLVIHCHKCPIDWGVEYIEGYTTCERDGSHYAKWLQQSVEHDNLLFDDPEREYVRENLMRLAAIVRDLPWRK